MSNEPPSLQALMSKLNNDNVWVRRQVLMAIMKIVGDDIDQKLFLTYFSGGGFWADPERPIPHARIAKAAEELKLSPAEVQSRYEALAQRFGLKLEWL